MEDKSDIILSIILLLPVILGGIAVFALFSDYGDSPAEYECDSNDDECNPRGEKNGE